MLVGGPPELLSRTERLLTRLGLPVSLSREELAAAWRFVGSDKKRLAGAVRLPIVDEVGRAHVEPISLPKLAEALGAA